jgi:tetratricopeptide (TPR) repeat protein
MRLCPALLIAGLAAAVIPAAPTFGDEPVPALPALFARVDQAWTERDQAGRMEAIRADLEAAAKTAPDDYGVLWRRARVLFWMADDPAVSKAEKSRLGKECWELADRATAAKPDGVEGWFYASAGAGNYSLGIGILSALTQGLEGKYKERLSRAEALDPKFSDGAIPTSWGRFWYELPWPKYSFRKSEAAFKKALELNPRNARALVYLAELYHKEDQDEDARKLLERAADQEPGAYDPPEERRMRARAKELLAKK